MSEATQSMDSAHGARSATRGAVGFNAAKTPFQIPSALLRFSAGNAVKLFFRYPSFLLRLWADSAPKPVFGYQSSLLRLWADNCELVAQNYETSFEAFRAATDQQQFGRRLQNYSTSLSKGDMRARAHEFSEQPGALAQDGGSLTSNQAQQDNKSLIDQTRAANSADSSAETPLAAAARPAKGAVVKETPKTRSRAANLRRQKAKNTSRTSAKKAAVKQAASGKKMVRKTMKSRTRRK